MKVYQALLVAYFLALAINAQAQGVGSNNGNYNGNYNLGDNNGVSNGLGSVGSSNGNGNGNENTGSLNGVGNGQLNLGSGNGNLNGNLNYGSQNGGFNGIANTGDNNGNNNGNNNYGSNNGNYNGQGNIGSGNGNNNGNANGNGDPMITGFAGRAFEFFGNPSAYYTLLSEKNHQITTKLKLGIMWDHNGTYMEGFGFQYKDQRISMELTPAFELAVTMNGEPLNMTKGETELEIIPYVEGGEMLMLWQKHREGLGNAVELTTDLLQVVIWVTPAGTVDEGGRQQPAYLNFDVALMGQPAGNHMEGIVGETYNRMLAGDALNDPESPLYLPDDYKFRGAHSEGEYAVEGYFGAFAHSLLGLEHKRLLIEGDVELAFPLRAFGAAMGRAPAAELARPLASGGRKGRFLL